MSNLNLTSEERSLVEAMARDSNGPGVRAGFYASVLVPVLLFAGYGIASWDILAVLFALVGLLIFVAWRIWLELTSVNIYRRLCQKIVAHERNAA